MESNTRSQELLAEARVAVERYAADGGDPEALLGLARTVVGLAAGGVLDGGVDDCGLVESVVALHRMEAVVHAEKLRRVAEVEQRGAWRGFAYDSVNLWTARLGVSRPEARTLVDSAGVLERMPGLAARHADGTLAAGHVADAARTVARLDRLVEASCEDGDGGQPASAGDGGDVRDEVVAALDEVVTAPPAVGGGGPVGRLELRRRLEAFAHERAPGLLADREQRLRARRSLRLSVDERDPDRPGRIQGELAPATYAKATAVIHAYARKHPAGDPRTFAQRCHDAFERILDLAAATGELPDLAGEQPRVLLLVQDATLHDEQDAPAAELDGYGPVSAGTARQICCDAQVTAVALGDGGAVLDVGRDRRTPNRAQRRGTFARDKACIGCRAPLAHCQIHHIQWWEHGGATDIDNLVAVCWDCHTRIHHTGWHVHRPAGGTFALRPPERARAREPDRLAG